ncbi:hypothetical protein GUITHDRAFT_132680 [Guillardia theta CCMP2712]|uniref:NACHT domain-containing protein n=1 Tax=Guillardia theta (strain CCMP2712) TaxID=905079 RepID=L1JZD7_GUITC|nr:hypothetical protein GUITHDRAFT_132680 [Guillardia theta CCMP2712]EKX53570.1 hypothetical protein GUITHDRAFT_132680 [Guillardia theta CCMP2712]|eukprot:XP_005840550.1 hypothetical protein GUITHDRAFT_132680 [Guillardia theta CCMP2712]
MGAAQSIAHVRNREARIRELESTVQELELQREEYRKLKIVADAEKKNLARQGLLVRENAARDRESKAIAEGQSQVDRSFMEAQYARSRASEQRALAELADLKSRYDILLLEHQALDMRRQAEHDQAVSNMRQAANTRLFSVLSLLENFNKSLDVLYEEIMQLRQDRTDFAKKCVNLCEKMNFKQVKVDSTLEFFECENALEEEKKRDRSILSMQAIEFLLSDDTIAKPLQAYLKASEDAKTQLLQSCSNLPDGAGELVPESSGLQDDKTREKIEFVDAKLKLNRRFEDLQTDTDRIALEKSVVTELSMSLGISQERFEVERFSRGSIIIHFSILPQKKEDAPFGRPLERRSSQLERKSSMLERRSSQLERRTSMLVKEELDSGFIAMILKDMVNDPSSRLRRGLVLSSCTEFSWMAAPEIPAREAKREIKRLEVEIEEVSKYLRAIKQQKEDQAEVLRRAVHASIEIQRVYRGMQGRVKVRRIHMAIEAADTLQRVWRGHVARVQFMKMKEAMDMKNEREREALLREAASLEKMQAVALRELAEAKQRYNERRNIKYGYSSSVAETSMKPKKRTRVSMEEKTRWWEAYQNEKLRDAQEILSQDMKNNDHSMCFVPEEGFSLNYHVRPLIFTTYQDFREERMLLLNESFPSLHQMCCDRGVAFCPVDPFLQIYDQTTQGRGPQAWQWVGFGEEAMLDDELVQSKSMLMCSMEDVKETNVWLFFVGGRYGWVPPAPLLRQAKQKIEWAREFYEESGMENSSLGEVMYTAIVVNRMDEISTKLKGRTFFFLRDDTYGDAFAQEMAKRFVEDDQQVVKQLEKFKESIRILPKGILTFDNYRDPIFAVRQATEWLQKSIKLTFPVLANNYESHRDRLCHSSLALSKRSPFIQQEELFDVLDAHIDPRQNMLEPIVLVGEGGSGKTTLLSKYLELSRGKLPQAMWFAHFIGCSSGSSDYQRLCVNLQQALKDRFSLQIEVNKKLLAEKMSKELSQWLSAAASKGIVILFIDALDAIDDTYDGSPPLTWLPKKFPARTRVILTCREGAAAEEIRARGWKVHQMPSWTKEAALLLAEQHLQQRSQWTDVADISLGPQRLDRIVAHPPCSNPLHLRYMVDELCREHQATKINPKDLQVGCELEWQLLFRANDVWALLDYVLHRWERQFDTARCPQLVRRVCSLLWGSCWGLSEYELLCMMPDVPRVVLMTFLESTKFTWIRYSGYILIGHSSMRDAIQRRFVPGPQEQREVHRRLGETTLVLQLLKHLQGGFWRSLPPSRRKLEEEIYHWRRSEQWANLMGVCSDMSKFPLLFEEDDAGTLHCDLRRCVREADKHIDAYKAGEGARERKVTSRTGAAGWVEALERIGVLLAKFLGEMGRNKEATEMYETILNQPAQGLQGSTETQHQVAELRYVDRSPISLDATAGTAERSFVLVNKAQDQFKYAFEALKELLVHDEREVEGITKDQTISQEEKDVALSQAELTLTKARTSFTAVLCKLGRLEYLAGDFESSQLHFEQAASFADQHLNPTHPLIAEALLGLGDLLFQRGRYEDAERATRRSMSIRQINLGGGHPLFAESIDSLAKIMEATGRKFEFDQLTARSAKIMSEHAVETASLTRQSTRVVQEDLEGSSMFGSIRKDVY